MAPHRPRSHQIADKSIVRLEDAFVSAGWTVEDLAKDYGEDLLVRIFKDGMATPYTFYVQAKSSDNIARYLRKKDDYIHFPFNAQHLTHWNDFWEPVVITIWDSQADVTYWETAQMAERSPDLSRRNPIFFIPRDNILDDEGLKRISLRTVKRHERFEMEQRGAQLLVDRLEEALEVKIAYDAQLGLLIVTYPDGNTQLTAFGKMAERLEKMSKELHISPDELVNRSIISSADIIEALYRGGELMIKDKKTGLITQRWTNPQDLMRDIERWDELRDTP
jgi:hypothetical protein